MWWVVFTLGETADGNDLGELLRFCGTVTNGYGIPSCFKLVFGCFEQLCGFYSERLVRERSKTASVCGKNVGVHPLGYG